MEKKRLQGESSSTESEESGDSEPTYPGQVQMYEAENAKEYLGNSWFIFSIFFVLYYLLQFFLALMCANFYSQTSPVRLWKFRYTTVSGNELKHNVPVQICGLTDAEMAIDHEVTKRRLAGDIYDNVLFHLGLFHIIEWIRTAILLTATCMGYKSLITFYRWTTPNVIYGFVAYVMAHFALFSARGLECWQKENQHIRGNFLLGEICLFYVVFGVSFLFVFFFPKMAFRLTHDAWKRREVRRLKKAEIETPK